MIVVDTNLLLYAYNESSGHHGRARRWVEEVFSGGETVGLPWTVIFGFIRIGTDPRAHTAPYTMEEMTALVSEWLERENVMALAPGPRHWQIVRGLLTGGRRGGRWRWTRTLRRTPLSMGQRWLQTIGISRASQGCGW